MMTYEFWSLVVAIVCAMASVILEFFNKENASRVLMILAYIFIGAIICEVYR